jgi:hypothetical protein
VLRQGAGGKAWKMKHAKRTIEAVNYQCPNCMELMSNPTNWSTVWTSEDFNGKKTMSRQCQNCNMIYTVTAPPEWQ